MTEGNNLPIKGAEELLADELEAAIEAWHDCAPSGQGESWSADATDKFNAMAQRFYDNSDRILTALRAPRPLSGEELVEKVALIIAREDTREQRRKGSPIAAAELLAHPGYGATARRIARAALQEVEGYMGERATGQCAGGER